MVLALNRIIQKQNVGFVNPQNKDLLEDLLIWDYAIAMELVLKKTLKKQYIGIEKQLNKVMRKHKY